MSYQVVKFKVPDSDGHWNDDCLDRRDVAKDFTRFLYSIHEPLVIGIDSPYGTGKSFFLSRWIKDLNDDGRTTVYFNAWETDYSESPLISFVVALRESLRAKGIVSAEGAIEGLVKTTGQIIVEAGIGTANKLTGIDVEKLKKFEKSRGREKQYGSFAEEKLESHLMARKGIESFKLKLQEIAKEISKKDSKKKPIYVFIDDLDRCRPDFAIELLEQIKHILSTENYIFILAIDRPQLGHIISSVYGSGIDSDGYIRKFIEYSLKLPEPDSNKFSRYLYKAFSLEEIRSSFPDRENFSSLDTLINEFGKFSGLFKLTLRQQTQCFSEINSALRLMETRALFFPTLISFLVCLRVKHSDLYNKLGTNYMSNASAVKAALKELLPSDVAPYFINDKNLTVSLYSCFMKSERDLRDASDQGAVELFEGYLEAIGSRSTKIRIIDHVKGLLELGSRYQ